MHCFRFYKLSIDNFFSNHSILLIFTLENQGMKYLQLSFFVLFTSLSFAQLKEIAFAELTAGSSIFFGAQMTPTTITVTLQGPADRYLAFGFGTGMANGNDAIIWSTLGTGAAPLQVRDHRMLGTGFEPSVDAQQDWTIISNNITGSNRTIVASRTLSTGDANDVTFNFAATTQNLFWAKAATATNQLQNHGGGNRASGIVRNWVLVDQTPPTLVSSVPVDNASGISLTQNITLTFNENISMGTGFINLFDSNDNLIQSVTNGSPGLTVTGSQIVWNPTANFIQNTSYYVLLDANAVKDAANNFYTGIAINTLWNFNTNDIVAPLLLSTIPADNSSSVNLNQNLSMTFNEPIQFGTGTISLYDISNNLIESFDVSSSTQLSIIGGTLTIDPTNDFTLNFNYYVNLTSGSIEDVSGNDYVGIANNSTWNWNTDDVTEPLAILPTYPEDDDTGVELNPLFNISFNEDIMLNSLGELSVYNTLGNLVESFNSSSLNVSISGNQLEFTLTSALSELTTYYVLISADFISDLSGNFYAGIPANDTWNFTTGDFTAPTIISTTPIAGEINVPVNINPTINFSEEVVSGLGNVYLVNEFNQFTEVFNAVNGNLNIVNNNVTFIPTIDLDVNTNYHFIVENNAFQDLSMLNFAGISDTLMWSFTTQDDLGINETSLNSFFTWNGKELKMNGSSQQAELLDLNGRVILKLQETQTLSDLFSSGIYLVKIYKDTEKVSIFKIYVE